MTTIKHFQITSSAGVAMGVYDGETPADALDAMARDAGYRDQADVAETLGETLGEPFDGTVVEVAGPTLCDYETGEAIREATPSEAAESAAQARLDGGAGVISVDGRSCYVEVTS